MRAPGITYAYTSRKDTAGPSFEVFNRTEQISSGSTGHVLSLEGIAIDRMLCLTNVSLVGRPGSTQFVNGVTIQVVTQDGVIVAVASDPFDHAPNEEVALNWSGSVYVLGGGQGNSTLRSSVFYNLGTNANTTQINWSGIIVPRGNAGAF